MHVFPTDGMEMDFPFARSVVVVRSRRTIKRTQQSTEEARHYLSSLDPDELSNEHWHRLIRGHWAGVENRNHWKRDALFGEDRSRSRNTALLTNLDEGDVLFVDEIHRLNPAVEEVLYPAMEDRALELLCVDTALDWFAADVDALVAAWAEIEVGLDAARIAQAFLVSPDAMTKRLVRAKQKIRLAGIPYEVPAPDQLAPRLSGVLAVVYSMFTEGYLATSGDDLMRQLGGFRFQPLTHPE